MENKHCSILEQPEAMNETCEICEKPFSNVISRLRKMICHIDGDCLNNDPENLMALHLKCHYRLQNDLLEYDRAKVEHQSYGDLLDGIMEEF